MSKKGAEEKLYESRDLPLEVVVPDPIILRGIIVDKYATHTYCNLLAIKREEGERFG